MTPRRRDVLVGGAAAGAIAAVAAIGHGVLRCTTASVALPASMASLDRGALILHDGTAAGMALVRAARRSAPGVRISDQPVAVLASRGFARTGALLDRARGRAVIALLDDADALVVEALLQVRGAQNLTRSRHDGQSLLTARI